MLSSHVAVKKDKTPAKASSNKRTVPSPPVDNQVITWSQAPEALPWLQYIEFKSQLMDPEARNNPFEAFKTFIQDDRFFKKVEKDYYRTGVTWSNFQDLYLSVKLSNENIRLSFFNYEKDKTIVVALAITPHDIQVTRLMPIAPWTTSLCEEIVNEFRVTFPNAKWVGSDKNLKEEKELSFNRSLQQFEAHVISQSSHGMTTRLLNTLQRPEAGLGVQQVTWLEWSSPQQLKPITLKVTLMPAHYHSYIFSEKYLVKEFYEGEAFNRPLYYHRVVIAEADKTAIEFWATPDGLVGELFKVNSTDHLTGTDSVNLFKTLSLLFRVDHLYLQDMATLTVPDPDSKEEAVMIPLRLSSLFLNEGVLSWYGKLLGFSPADCDHWESAWNELVKLNQDTKDYYKAAMYLRTVSLSKMMKDLEISPIRSKYRWIQSMCKTHFPSRALEEITLKEFAQLIFDRQRKTKNKKDKTAVSAFNDLVQLHDLLDWGTLDNQLLDKDDHQGKVRIISNELPMADKLINTSNSLVAVMNTRMFGLFKHPDAEKKPSLAFKSSAVTIRSNKNG